MMLYLFKSFTFGDYYAQNNTLYITEEAFWKALHTSWNETD